METTSPRASSTMRTQAGQILAALSAAVKYAGLYPEDHAFHRNTLRKLNREMQAYLAAHGSLHFEITRTAALVDGQTVFERPEEEASFISLLARDGILEMAFHPGVEERELRTLIRIVSDHAILDDEDDEDIATALWQEDLEHIDYRAVDPLEGMPLFDLGSCKVQPADHPARGDGADGQDGGNGAGGPVNGGGSSPGEESAMTGQAPGMGLTLATSDMWALTPEERAELERQVALEEDNDHVEDVIEVALIILLLQDTELDVQLVLDFLEEHFFQALEQGKFTAAYNLVRNMRAQQKTLEGKRPWTAPLLTDFFKRLSAPEALALLPRLLREDPRLHQAREMDLLARLLGALEPGVLPILAAVLGVVRKAEARAPLIRVVMAQARRSPQALLEAVQDFDEEVCLLLFALITGMPRELAVPLLKKLCRHQARAVREEGVEMLVKRQPRHIDFLPDLLADPSPRVQDCIAAYLARGQVAGATDALMEFLRSSCGKGRPEYIVACFRALGRTAGNEALPFLEAILFEKQIKGLLARSSDTCKLGAALALREIATEEAGELLLKGTESMLRPVRSACEQALEEWRKGR